MTRVPLICLLFATAGCGSAQLNARKAEVEQASAEYAQANVDFAGYQAEQAVRAKTSFAAGMAAYEAFMAVTAPAGAGPDQAEAWYTQRIAALEAINDAFGPVQTSTESGAGLKSRVRQGEAAAKLLAELDGMLGGEPDKVMAAKVLVPVVDKAVYYYNAVPAVYVRFEPALAKQYPDEVAKADVGLRAMVARQDAVQALIFGP